MNKKLITLLSISFLSVFPMVALAAVSPEVWIETILKNFLNIVVWPVFLGAATLMFIYAGFMFLTAEGEPGKITAAKKAVIWGIIGIIVAVLAFSVVGIIQRVIAPANPAPINQNSNPNPNPNPPALGACNIPGITNISCIDEMTLDGCVGANGTFLGPGSSCPAAQGACVDLSGHCFNPTTRSLCDTMGGTYAGDGQPCP